MGKDRMQVIREGSMRQAGFNQDVKLRTDCSLSMRKLCPQGFRFNSSLANDKGWYGDTCNYVTISPSEAEELFNLHHYENQRQLRDDWAQDLADNIREGLDISIAIGPSCFPVVVNGQHTLWAIVLKGSPVRCKVSVTQCRDEQAIADFYACFDSGIRRLTNQVLAAHYAAGAISSSVQPNKLHKWTTIAELAKAGFKRNKTATSNSARIKAAQDPTTQAFAEFMERMSAGQNGGAMRNLVPQGVGAAFFCMFVSDPENAEVFIQRYFSGADLKAGHPCLVLREYMNTRDRNTHGDINIGDHAGLTFTAWKKFCLGESITLLRKTKDVPDFDSWRFAAASVDAAEVEVAELNNPVNTPAF